MFTKDTVEGLTFLLTIYAELVEVIGEDLDIKTKEGIAQVKEEVMKK